MIRRLFAALLIIYGFALPFSQGSHSKMFQTLMRKNLSKKCITMSPTEAMNLWQSSRLPSNFPEDMLHNCNTFAQQHPGKRTICVNILKIANLADCINELSVMDFLGRQKKKPLIQLYDLLLLESTQDMIYVRSLLLQHKLFRESWAMIFDKGKFPTPVNLKMELICSLERFCNIAILQLYLRGRPETIFTILSQLNTIIEDRLGFGEFVSHFP